MTEVVFEGTKELLRLGEVVRVVSWGCGSCGRMPTSGTQVQRSWSAFGRHDQNFIFRLLVGGSSTSLLSILARLILSCAYVCSYITFVVATTY